MLFVRSNVNLRQSLRIKTSTIEISSCRYPIIAYREICYLRSLLLLAVLAPAPRAKRCCSRTAASSKATTPRLASVAENPLSPKTHGRRSAGDAAHRGRRRPAADVHPQLPGRAGARRRRRPRTCGSTSGSRWPRAGGGVGRIGRATRSHAVRRIRPAHLRNAKHRRPARRRAGHHANHAALHQGRRPERRPAADRLGHANRHEQHSRAIRSAASSPRP